MNNYNQVVIIKINIYTPMLELKCGNFFVLYLTVQTNFFKF